jgi:GNAT superfamily N-acetyltransferase
MDNSYRSRGLWVFPKYRGQHIGFHLLVASIEQGIKEKTNYVWSYPKLSSWNTYQSVGFELSSDWHQSEQDINAYCKLRTK